MTTTTLTAVQDQRIRDTLPNTNPGDSDLAVSKGSHDRRSLIEFDLSSIPTSGVVFSSVTLRLYCLNVENTNSITVSAFRVVRNWLESQVTWNIATTGDSWGTAGCENTSTDRSGTNAGSVAITTGSAWYEISFNTSEFESMLSNNEGLILIVTGGADNSYKTFHSSEFGANPPELVIEYTPGGGQDAQAVWFG